MMEVGHPHSPLPTPEELRDLKKLMAVLERATADKVISKDELKKYRTHAWADGKITPEELHLLQELVLSKVTAGELEWDHDE